jgi:iron complex outermembrane receptor protein
MENWIRTVVFILFSSLGLLAQAQYALRDTIPLGEVLIKAKTHTGDVAAGVSTQRIDTLVMQQQMVGSVGELLASHTPVFIKSHGRGALATASIRGAGASHTAVLWNNIPINSPMTGQVDFSLLPVYFADQMELYYGGASLQNSNGALGGSIAIQSNPDWTPGVSAKLMQNLGQFQTWGSFGEVNFSKQKWNLRARIFYETSQNNYTYYQPANRTTDESGWLELKDAEGQKGGLLNELYYRINGNSVAGLKLWYQQSRRKLPALINSSVYRHHEKQDNNNLKLLAFYKHYGGRLTWELQTAWINDGLDYLLQNQAYNSNVFVTHYQSQNLTRSSITNYQSTLKLKHDWKLEWQVLGRYDRVEVDDLKTQQGYSREQSEFSGKLALHKTLGERWYFSALLRHLWIDSHWVKPIPSLGMEYLLSKEQNIRLKAHGSCNYHYPSLNDRYYVPGGNPQLKPEEGSSLDGGLHQQKTFGTLELEQSLGVYFSTISNWIQWTPSEYGYWMPTNYKMVFSRGMEYHLMLAKKLGPVQTHARLQYAWSPTTNESEDLAEGDASQGQQLIYIPRHSGSTWVYMQYKSLRFTWLTSYLGQRQTATVADDQFIPLSAYWLTNLSLGLQKSFPRMNVGLRLGVENLFNASYQNIKDRPMPMRNFSLLLKIDLK